LPPRSIAVIGCGAIAESFHLPALVAVLGGPDRLVLVDRNVDRAQALARQFEVTAVAADHREVLEDVGGALITTPHQFHHAIAMDCIAAGAHVLCEKPLTDRPEEGEALVAAAERYGVTIAMNNTRRVYPASRYVKQLLEDGTLGTLQRMDWEEGEPFNWPCASPSYFGVAAEGRGVLADKGSHVLDLMCWWLGGTPHVTDYADDALGGTEAVADIRFAFDGVPGHARFSWFNKLRNTFQVVGDRATVEGRIYDSTVVTMTRDGGRPATVRLSDPHDGDVAHAIAANFVDVVDRGAIPLVSAQDVLPSIALIDACYARRRPFPMPWLDPQPQAVAHG